VGLERGAGSGSARGDSERMCRIYHSSRPTMIRVSPSARSRPVMRGCRSSILRRTPAMSGEDGSVTLVFNGEIYTSVSCSQVGVARPPLFKPIRYRSDRTRLEEFGPSCLHELRGMFAFAIWDAEARSLLSLVIEQVRNRFTTQRRQRAPSYSAPSLNQFCSILTWSAKWTAKRSMAYLT